MRLRAVIFDVDGVLVASPHERAWQTALEQLMAGEWATLANSTTYAPERFSTAVYQAYVAGKPRLSGAAAVLSYFGVPAAEERALTYAERKQQIIEQLINEGAFTAFSDALQFAIALREHGLRLGVASSSKNANWFMCRVRTAGVPGCSTLLDLFEVNVCGRELPFGKPHPAIFLLAAQGLAVDPSACVVVEDAPSGIQAAKAGGMLAIGVARLNDAALLHAAGADLVVASLDEVALESVANGPPLRRTARQPDAGQAHAQ